MIQNTNDNCAKLPAAGDSERPRLPNLLNPDTAVGCYRPSFRFYVKLAATFGGLHHPTATGVELQGLPASRNYAKAESHEQHEMSRTCFNSPEDFLLYCKNITCRLGGVVVSVLATGPKGRGFKHGRGDGFLRTIEIRSTPSFGWEVKREGLMS
jgi:hypothetical protein